MRSKSKNLPEIVCQTIKRRTVVLRALMSEIYYILLQANRYLNMIRLKKRMNTPMRKVA